ncbi:hypothetical protein [Mycetocola saprophilus]|uniref:hypothetical protein n=1 Tax=Mycetocola saprophilus TaxID=76636 RepID=UPI003BEFD48C
MSGGNSLVAGPVNTTTPFSGLWLIEDGQGIAAGIENGDWLATGMSVVGGALDAAAAIIDPIGQLLGMGMAWVLDHIAPISDWFKQLTGDAGQVAGFGQTWANVATRMHESGDLLSNRLGDLEGMAGATIDAYRAYAGDFAKHLHMLGDWSKAISTGLQAASTLVQVVHDLIRDILSQLVGTAVSAVVTSAVTLGAGIPVAIAQIGTRLASLLPKATKAIKGMVESFKALQNMIRQLGPIIAKAGKTFSELMRKFGHAVSSKLSELMNRIRPNGHSSSVSSELTQETIDKIRAIPHGERPDPSTYLSPEYIREHLAQFEGGATRFVSRDNFETFGLSQRDGTSFVMASNQFDTLMSKTGGDLRAMETELGLPEYFLDEDLLKVEIPNPERYDLRLPSGNESGANDQWIPGGKLPGGISEGVINGREIDLKTIEISGFGEHNR